MLKTWREGLAGRDVTNRNIAEALDLSAGAARKVINGLSRAGGEVETAKTLLKAIQSQPASARDYLQGIADGLGREQLAEIEERARSESPPETEEASNQVDACQQPKSTKPSDDSDSSQMRVDLCQHYTEDSPVSIFTRRILIS